MSDLENKKNEQFLIEKIKQRPVNKKKLLRRTLITAAMAVVFGLIACLTFLILEPVFSNWLYPEEDPRVILFPEDQEEMSPEEMLANNMQAEKEIIENMEQENTPVELEDKQIEEILSGVVLTKDNYQQIYAALSTYVTELNRCLVTVIGVSSDVDWLDNILEIENKCAGLVAENNGKELLILVDYGAVKDAEKLIVSFGSYFKADAQIKQFDTITNLAILSINLSEIPKELLDKHVSIADMGSSNAKNLLGLPVIALGSPIGYDSIGHGIITSINNQITEVDANYRMLITDIFGSQNAGGFLFNLQGEMVGIITTNTTGNQDLKNVITAYGISDLKKLIAKMSNGQPVPYVGISGVDVTTEVHEELQVPYGAYVKEVIMDSPAMLAGIQQGDVIVAANGQKIQSFADYSSVVIQNNVGQLIEFTVMRQVQEEYNEMNFKITLAETK